jgi:hypothetical protein
MSTENKNSLATEKCDDLKRSTCSSELSSSTEKAELSEGQLNTVAGGLQVKTAIKSLPGGGFNRCESVAK